MHRLAVAIAVGALVIAVGVGAAAPSRAARGAAVGVELGDCPKKVRPKKLRCGRLEVPLERADPAQGTIPIRFAVRTRSHANLPSAGTVVAVEGGPGYGSIGSARYFIHMLGPVLDDHELVMVDMRGTGHSQAIDCPDLQQGRGSDSHGVAQCARLLGEDFGSYRTSASADDLDAIREALGLERIELYGDSYGTFLAQSYAYRHRESLAAMVLDGAYPLHGESGWFPSNTRTGLRSLSIACRRRPARCHGDASGRLREIVPILRRTPRGAAPLLEALGSAGYEPPLRNYTEINTAISAYLDGDRGLYERLIKVRNSGYGTYRFNSRGQELAVSCNDYPTIWEKPASRNERRAQLEAAIRAYPKRRFVPFTPREVAFEGFSTHPECLAWPQPSAFYEPPKPPGAAPPMVPALIVAGELDDVTTPAEARKVAKNFPNSRLRIVRNAGHIPSLYGGRYPARDWVRRFLSRH